MVGCLAPAGVVELISMRFSPHGNIIPQRLGHLSPVHVKRFDGQTILAPIRILSAVRAGFYHRHVGERQQLHRRALSAGQSRHKNSPENENATNERWC